MNFCYTVLQIKNGIWYSTVFDQVKLYKVNCIGKHFYALSAELVILQLQV